MLRKKILSDFLYYLIDMGFVAAIGWLFYIIMGKMLVPAEYGALMTIIAFFLILTPLTAIGFNEAMAKFIPELLMKKDRKRIKSYLKWVLKYSLLLAFAVALFIFFFAEIMAVSVYANPALTGPLRALSILLLVGTTALLFKGVLQGFRQFKQILVFDLSCHFLRILLPIAFVLAGFGVVGGIIGWAACFALFSLLAGFFVLRSLPKGSKSKPEGRVLRYGVSSALSVAGLWVLVQTGLLILGFVDMRLAGLFAVALVFGQILLFPPIVVNGVLLPNISHLWVGGQLNKARRLLELSIKHCVLILAPAIAMFVLLAPGIIRFVYNPSYLAARDFLPLFLSGSLALGLALLLLMALYAISQPIFRPMCIWAGVLLNLFLSIALYHFLGPVGVAAGFLIAQVILLAFVSFVAHSKMGVRWPARLERAIPAFLAFVFAVYLIDAFYVSFAVSVFLLLVALMIYAGLLWLLRIFVKDDKILFKTLRRVKII
jgi:O-antigen/teichoic acid export membrane protein